MCQKSSLQCAKSHPYNVPKIILTMCQKPSSRCAKNHPDTYFASHIWSEFLSLSKSCICVKAMHSLPPPPEAFLKHFSTYCTVETCSIDDRKRQCQQIVKLTHLLHWLTIFIFGLHFAEILSWYEKFDFCVNDTAEIFAYANKSEIRKTYSKILYHPRKGPDGFKSWKRVK